MLVKHRKDKMPEMRRKTGLAEAWPETRANTVERDYEIERPSFDSKPVCLCR